MKRTDTRIDWDDVKKRLHASQLALEKALTPDAERIAAIFRQRAAHLAQRGQAAVVTNAKRMLVFVLNADHYALDFGAVVELFPFANCSPVPGAPAGLLGVINVHGEIRSVVELGRLLELPDLDARAPGYVLLVQAPQGYVGLRVDGIDKILPMPAGELAIPTSETSANLRFVHVVTPEGIRLLNLAALQAHPLFTKADPL